jgi:hypothetical protein
MARSTLSAKVLLKAGFKIFAECNYVVHTEMAKNSLNVESMFTKKK